MSTPPPIYDKDGIRIYHGDCRKILRLLPLTEVDTVLTDPPYGIATKTRYKSAGRGPVDFPAIRGDRRPFEPGFLLLFPRVIIFGANYFSHSMPRSASWIVWDKRRGVTTNDQADCELAWTNLPGRARVYRHLWMGAIRDSERGVRRVHPTQKPVALMRWCLEAARPQGVVLDPYMGSGSTLLAACALGLRAIGIELSAAYCRAAVRRLEDPALRH